MSTIICDCYDPRLQSAAAAAASGSAQAAARDDGALPESQLIDYSVSESAFWWPCGLQAQLSSSNGPPESLEALWAAHLFDVIVNPNGVLALIDHAAITCATILSKHLLLARDVVFTCVIRRDDASATHAMTKGKPIITLLLEKLCAWPAIATIPVAVHGALFESIGGISEILNVVDAHERPSEELVSFTAVLKQYQLHLMAYLTRICDEVLVKGLMNPLRFPVVAQHTTLCLLSPTPAIDQSMKRLLAHVAAAKNAPAKQQSVLESFLISTHRNTEAYLRGVLSLLQSLRLFDFHVAVALPTLKKIVFIWSKVFEMLGASLEKILSDSLTASATHAPRASTAAATVNLQKLPVLINDFLIALLTNLYGPHSTATAPGLAMTLPRGIDDAVLVRVLDFALAFWVFWTDVLKDKMAGTKRSAGLIAPLVRCIERGSVAQRPRAAELLMLVLETLLRYSVALDESALRYVESVKSVAASIESKRSTDFARMARKFRQLDRTSGFFTRKTTVAEWRTLRDTEPSLSAPTPRTAASSSGSTSSSSRAKALKQSDAIDLTGSSSSARSGTFAPSTRPMSGKAAARAQSRMTVDLTGIDDASADAQARRNHSFYTESDYVTPRTREPSPMDRDASTKSSSSSRTKSDFSISQVVRGLAHAHGTASQPRSSSSKSDDRAAVRAKQQAAEAAADAEAQDEALQFAGLFHRIKHTQKPIPVCSLLPFYRQLLQLCMPQLLTRAFENERSDRVLAAPAQSFSKSAEYVNAYLPLLLEECSNELHEGLRKFYSSSGGHLLRYESEKPREGMRCLSFTIADVDEAAVTQSFFFKSQQRHNQRGTPKDKVFRNGDVVLLRTVASPSASRSDHHVGSFLGTREFLGVVLISDVEKGKKRVTMTNNNSRTGTGKSNNSADDEQETVKVLFLNDGELESVTDDVPAFAVETLAASAIADSEWKVHCVANLTTSAREYISLRSVDMLPEHLRTTILTPNVYKSTQTELLMITAALDDLRSVKTPDADAKVLKLLERLDKMDVTLMDLRSTSIGKAVNKLRKHDHADAKALANRLKDKWTQLMNATDALERAPRFLSTELWDAIKAQYNQSQLQSVHSVLNNYNVGISLLQGPPGTGKTKTIMGLLSGFLSLQPPALAIMPSSSTSSSLKTASTRPSSSDKSSSEFSNFQLARDLSASSAQTPRPTFSLQSVTSAMGGILRRSDADTASGAKKPSTIQALKNATSVRSRLEDKLSARKSSSFQPTASSSLVVRQRVVSSGPRMRRSNNVLLCAPSNGAVDELVLRIVTDGLMDSSGKVTKVRAPSVHPEALSEDWLSIVRLGNPGEDAPDSVKAVCLPQIIKRELEIHPKSLQLRALQDTQQTLRKSIKDFHQRAKEAAEASEAPQSRKGLAQIHAQLTKCSGEVRRLRDEVFALRTKMTAAILSRASIIACTLSKSGSGPLSGLQRGFDALIIDEAAQAVELSTLVPIRERVARVVLVGDPKQLPATVKSVVAANARYDRSLFERIAASGVAPSMLRVQYRMHPFLREFPSKRFYNGMLTDGPSVMDRVARVCTNVYARPCFQPFVLYDVSNSREEDMSGSKYNRVEAQFCVELCANLFETCADVRKQRWTVGFVSPYKEQVRVLRRALATSRVPQSIDVEVNTVDGFQGREKDVIVFSCVRASARGGIGFLKDIRRLNVAITRARFCLFVVGHVETLKRDETWAALVRSASDRRLIVRTHGQSFDDVARRLESDENRSLVAHFQDMHARVAKKQATPVASTSSSGNGDASASSAAQDAPAASDPEVPAAATGSEATKTATVSTESRPPLKIESSETTTTTATADSAPVPLRSSSASAQPSPTGSTTSAATHARGREDARANGQDQRPRDADTASSSRDSRSHRDRSHGRRDRSRDRASPREHHHRDDESRYRDDRDRKRTYADESRAYDRRSAERSKRPRHDDHSSSGNRYGPSDRSSSSSHSRRDDHRASSYGPTRPPTTSAHDLPSPPKSISAKEFCMENEPRAPTPRRPGDRSVTSSSSDRTKRPRSDESSGRPPPMLFPPGHKYHAREQRSHNNAATSPRSTDGNSSRSGYRSVSLTTVTSSSSSNHVRPPSGRGPSPSANSNRSSGGVLGNILGSASRLASATSRVHDKTVDRSREFQ